MNDQILQVIEKKSKWACVQDDAINFLQSLPDDSIDLLVTSPPYEKCRTYGLKKALPAGQDWVDWMVKVVTAAAPKVKGLIAINCEGQTRGYKYSCVPFLLMADLHRAGFNLRKPLVFHRVGIPGSGGPDWFRNDWEPIICVTREGKLPWSENTACGHPPKWAPGGEMSHRLSSGKRRTQWGGSEKSGNHNGKNGKTSFTRPSHRTVTKKNFGHDNVGSVKGSHEQDLCAIANPGNVLKIDVGGGMMGHDLAHDNEAPYPVELPAFLVKSCCPPGGVTADPFIGSGTTLQAAVECGRRGIGCDVRQSQVELTRKRMGTITLPLFAV